MSLDAEIETTEEQPSTGLCANGWCQDAALPDQDLCRECLLDLLEFTVEEDSDDRAA